ncbi:hypothetical protein Dimus_013306 [Dionaea muscipula]
MVFFIVIMYIYNRVLEKLRTSGTLTDVNGELLPFALDLLADIELHKADIEQLLKISSMYSNSSCIRANSGFMILGGLLIQTFLEVEEAAAGFLLQLAVSSMAASSDVQDGGAAAAYNRRVAEALFMMNRSSNSGAAADVDDEIQGRQTLATE